MHSGVQCLPTTNIINLTNHNQAYHQSNSLTNQFSHLFRHNREVGITTMKHLFFFSKRGQRMQRLRQNSRKKIMPKRTTTNRTIISSPLFPPTSLSRFQESHRLQSKLILDFQSNNPLSDELFLYIHITKSLPSISSHTPQQMASPIAPKRNDQIVCHLPKWNPHTARSHTKP